jgi:hypothetical protein
MVYLLIFIPHFSPLFLRTLAIFASMTPKALSDLYLLQFEPPWVLHPNWRQQDHLPRVPMAHLLHRDRVVSAHLLHRDRAMELLRKARAMVSSSIAGTYTYTFSRKNKYQKDQALMAKDNECYKCCEIHGRWRTRAFKVHCLTLMLFTQLVI